MQQIHKIESIIKNNTERLIHLKFEKINHEYVVTLIDQTGYEIIKGYGNEIIEAINDMYSNLL